MDNTCLVINDESQEMEYVRCVWNNNAEFYKSRSPDAVSDFQSHHILGIAALRNIFVGEELYCGYSSSIFLGAEN